MPMRRIEDCNLNILRNRVGQITNNPVLLDKGECIQYLRNNGITVIHVNNEINHINSETFGTTQFRNYSGDINLENDMTVINSSPSYTGEQTRNTVQIERNLPSYATVNNRQYSPIPSTNDAIFSNMMIVGTLDVYHEIRYGPLGTNLATQIENLTNTLGGNLDSLTPELTFYVPDIRYITNTDYANVDYGNVTYSSSYLGERVVFKLDMTFFDIDLTTHEYKVDIPYPARNVNSLNSVLLTINYDYNNNVYNKSSTQSSLRLNPTNLREVIIDSGLFQMFSNITYTDYQLQSSQFNVDFTIQYASDAV